MSDFVLIPGAWMGAWVWEPVADGDADVSEVGLETHVGDASTVTEFRTAETKE